MDLSTLPLADLGDWQRAYAAGAHPAELLPALRGRLLACDDPGIFLHVIDEAALAARLAALGPATGKKPLWGIPFAVKDNIDVAGMPTSAACPAFAYAPDRDAGAVQRLVEAGAIPMAKTNLDQFATGLVGVRTPHPVPRNPRAPGRVPGGSSSGSAVAVARGLLPFSLGTDTAGSGRIPAGLCGLVGLKPTPGAVSSRGVVPACRSLDCVSLFTRGVAEAWAVQAVLAGPDAEDPWSREFPLGDPASAPAARRIGVPDEASRRRFDAAAEAAWDAALARLEGLGLALVPVDFSPFFEVAALLYEGAWVAERLAALEDFLDGAPDGAVLPVTRGIIEGQGSRHSAADAFRALHRLQALRHATQPLWAGIDALAVPTAPLFPTLEELEADPIGPNARLGTYTNFVNLLGLAALAVPGPDRPDGLPAGATFIGPGGSDAALAALGLRFEAAA
ncbi:allophanate hydrolase [Teichococcus cervicalis]|uniref:Putative allophanate hydrolase n=1 Tax=Pseudoroseomonas cervicalis ATCC 49957 TaxID=525371 RepID=D5RN63_9PROT|nr:allophanate hydrolase [Pseudoroseomonas cervicalis]EFH11245.1 putative allophanate hydrolase [Pseudoroseomonas cervicalis ATCC 49957]